MDTAYKNFDVRIVKLRLFIQLKNTLHADEIKIIYKKWSFRSFRSLWRFPTCWPLGTTAACCRQILFDVNPRGMVTGSEWMDMSNRNTQLHPLPHALIQCLVV